MSQNFMSQTNRLWMEIYQIVKENCSSEYGGATPQDDVMERLLSAPERKMSMTKYKTAESVRRGHPDKLCDLIADSILDECLRHDRYSSLRLRGHGHQGKNLCLRGEITCAEKINIRSVVREVLRKVGYNPLEVYCVCLCPPAESRHRRRRGFRAGSAGWRQ